MPRVWGGSYLRDVFHIDTQEPIGEAWLLSDHPSGQTKDAHGRTLHDLKGEAPWFPVLIKLLHANDDLSVQVHPNDEQARLIGDRGKTEGWLILHAEPDSRICYGLTSQSAEEMRALISDHRFTECLRYVPVQTGQYFPVPPGTVHALCGGILALEVQQASDTTYRLYDYDRLDQHGKLRDLHIEQGIAVTAFPQPQPPQALPVKTKMGDVDAILYDDNEFYTLYEVHVDGDIHIADVPGSAFCVIQLEGTVAPIGVAASQAAYPTWVFEPGEAVRMQGSGRAAIVRIPLSFTP